MLKSIPTPTRSEFGIGPLTIHFYALCIVAGIAVAIFWGDRRFRKRGGGSNVVADVAVVAVPAGIIGGRFYHLITSPDAYFGAQGKPFDALKIWNGGLGIWGAVALGTYGAWWQYRRISRRGREDMLSFAQFADSLAPGVLVAQALGRIGNWFNAELFGKPTNLPWGLQIPLIDRPNGYENFPTFHPTFLYEALWCIAVALLIVLVEKHLVAGQTFLLYIGMYCVSHFV
ncbi:MAG: prolipoprotein diacylglyceryl transferase [Actinobacteria bacterium]|nr:prolipoprotein diacylglyceryl transferase [Actinomycetota bacterium]